MSDSPTITTQVKKTRKKLPMETVDKMQFIARSAEMAAMQVLFEHDLEVTNTPAGNTRFFDFGTYSYKYKRWVNVSVKSGSKVRVSKNGLKTYHIHIASSSMGGLFNADHVDMLACYLTELKTIAWFNAKELNGKSCVSIVAMPRSEDTERKHRYFLEEQTIESVLDIYFPEEIQHNLGGVTGQARQGGLENHTEPVTIRTGVRDLTSPPD